MESKKVLENIKSDISLGILDMDTEITIVRALNGKYKPIIAYYYVINEEAGDMFTEEEIKEITVPACLKSRAEIMKVYEVIFEILNNCRFA